MELMVDGELWTRFFLLDDIWHLDLVIGGFRRHGKNRSHSEIEIVYNEMNEVINVMKTRLSPKLISSFNILKEYLNLIQISKKNEIAIRRRKLLKILPYFLYTSVIRYMISKKKIQLNIKYETYDYKLLNYIDDNWIKSTRKFNSIE